ncbi:MAG: DUF2442 domain-containing protein [Clostridia bacterium]|nr:DUF2442 domain-containing protein [Clostridia bacterium]
MYIYNGIVYAGNQEPPLKISGVRPLADHRLWIRFSNGEAKIFDCKPLLEKPAYLPLQNIELFNAAYIDYGIVTWQDGDIDIATEYLYENGVNAEEVSNA